MSPDWYRSPSWNPEDRDHFEAKLARARPTSRAQYLRIQGVTLAEASDKRTRDLAGDLLERVIREYRDDEFQVALAHADLGRWHRAAQRDEAAIRHYRTAVGKEAKIGNVDTGADLALAELLVKDESSPRAEIRALLDRARENGLAFKSQRWRWLATDARLAASTGDAGGAAQSAREALQLLEVKEPDFPRHADLGHIDADRRTVKQLRQLAQQ